ncbi:hypothetical protein I2I11_20525 [Pontibacter sp. 172403-2]|uniref:hypothetical protein n=1 Tax=Pontibacter rufus TaxID=2791028 RepID=UPI0018AF730B|nr:hypothetical protein [Pontibacter sp. 172403-2]MBF9255695.1 hypothetical protein [Pontibacter sp. 172403-2]
MDRRDSLRVLFLGGFPAKPGRLQQQETPVPAQPGVFRSSWESLPDGAWAGEAFGAEQPQGWCIQGGELLCMQAGPNHSVQLLTHRLAASAGPFILSLQLRFLAEASLEDTFAHAGWLLGLKDCSAAVSAEGAGIRVGVQRCGRLFIGLAVSNKFIPDEKLQEGIRLVLKVVPQPGGTHHAKLTALDKAGNTLAIVKSEQYYADDWQGSIAVLSHSDVEKTDPEPVVSFGFMEAAGERLEAQGEMYD